MLDPMILLDLRAPTPPMRPETVIERQHVPPKLEAAKRWAERLVSSYEDAIASWIERTQQARETIEISAPEQDLSKREWEQITQIIEDLEYHAELRALNLRRLMKRGTRDTKHWFSIDPSFGAIARSYLDRLIAADERAIDALLEHALYVRAFRAERDPDARDGPAFEEPEELGRYLRQAVAT